MEENGEYRGYYYNQREDGYYIIDEKNDPWIVKIKTIEEVQNIIDSIIKNKKDAEHEKESTKKLEADITELQLAMTELAELILGGAEIG